MSTEVHHVPHPARPQRRRPRRLDRLLQPGSSAPSPAKSKPGYANFAVAEPPLKLVLIENPGQGGSINHLGVEVADIDTVDAEQTRLAGGGLASVDERGTTCCYAKQDKFWVEGAPNGERWEVYTVLADSRDLRPRRVPRGVHCGLLRHRTASWCRPPRPAAERPRPL